VYELLILGGGPTGLAAALAAHQRGLRPVVLEANTGVIDKACGEGLMPGAVQNLHRLGVHPEGVRFRGIRYQRGDVQVDGRFPGEAGLGVRRLALHTALRQAVDDCGIPVRRHRVRHVEAFAQFVQVDNERARWVIAADGLRSPTRKMLGLDRAASGPKRLGLRQHFRVTPWSDLVEVHWAEDAEAYVTPVGPDNVGIAFLYGEAARQADKGKPGTPFRRLLARFPYLEERLQHAAATSTPRGAGPFAQRSAAPRLGRVLLAGDASGYIDPLTGEGLALGFQNALDAADALVAETPEQYDKAWRRAYAAYARPTKALLTLTQWPLGRRAMFPVLRMAPWILRAVVRRLAHAPEPPALAHAPTALPSPPR